ncbi:pentapeptide repeat-containing protein [Streptomyces sp. NPDC050095]|uniref:pentapeptide repeat-containing protein n=1 Tax=unclassified Streptomyces TaxID=2593676 RepID=UPI00343A3139
MARQGERVIRLRKPTAPRMSPLLHDASMPEDSLEDDAILKGKKYDGTPFISVQAEAVETESCEFANVRFTGTHLRRSQFGDSRFQTCDFSQLTAHDVSLIRCTVAGSRITGSSWKSGTFRDVRFESCVAAPAMFRHIKLFAVEFIDCKLTGADFQSADMHNVRFENCDLTRGQFANAKMSSVRFENCTLLDVGGVASLKGATVQGPGSMELALSLARETGILLEP